MPLLLLLTATLGACDDSGGETPTPVPDVQDTEDTATTILSWSPTGTSAVPQYGTSCRVATDDDYAVASDGATDDSFTLTTDQAGAGDATLVVKQGGATLVDAVLTLERGLVGKSLRNGSRYGLPPRTAKLAAGQNRHGTISTDRSPFTCESPIDSLSRNGMVQPSG